MTTSLVIPAYNEAKRLTPFLNSLQNLVTKHPQMLQEIIVVDDGSTDTTAVLAKQAIPTLPMLKVIQQPQNRGKGAAVKTGVMAASGDIIIFMDADGATDASEIPRMLEIFRSKQPDIVIGNRFLPGAKTDRHSALRQFSGYINRLYMHVFGLGHIDVMCGFKGYKADIARRLFTNLIQERWLFDTEIAYKAIKSHYQMYNLPITWESKDGSKLPTRTLVKSAFQIWPLIRQIHKQAS